MQEPLLDKVLCQGFLFVKTDRVQMHFITPNKITARRYSTPEIFAFLSDSV